MLEAGILDPIKITRLALQKATSVAGLLLTAEVITADALKDGGGARARPAGWWHGDVSDLLT